MKAWAVAASVAGAVGWLIGCFGDYGPNGPGIGVLIGVATATVAPLVFFLLGSHSRVDLPEDVARERCRAEARRRSRKRNKRRRIVLLATSAIGYLGGAVWNGGLIYDGWLSYIVTTDWLFLVALIVFSDPDEPWPAPFWPE